jgi:hypothetical protein
LQDPPIFLKGCPGWGANPGPLNFIYFLIFTTLPLSHSGSPQTLQNLPKLGSLVWKYNVWQPWPWGITTPRPLPPDAFDQVSVAGRVRDVRNGEAKLGTIL